MRRRRRFKWSLLALTVVSLNKQGRRWSSDWCVSYHAFWPNGVPTILPRVALILILGAAWRASEDDITFAMKKRRKLVPAAVQLRIYRFSETILIFAAMKQYQMSFTRTWLSPGTSSSRFAHQLWRGRHGCPSSLGHSPAAQIGCQAASGLT